MEEENSRGLCAVCQIPCELKCSACKQFYYCTADHQKEHWKVHKEFCNKSYEILQSKELGRHLVATKTLAPDDEIFTESPYFYGPRPHKLEPTDSFPCVGCCKLLHQNTTQQCPNCFWPACSPNCAGLQVPGVHGFECRILRLRPLKEDVASFFDHFRFDVLIVLRALYLQKVNKQKFDEMMSLEDHLESRGVGTETYAAIQEKVDHLNENYLNPLKLYEKESNQTIIAEVSDQIIHKIYAILDVNATELTEEVEIIVLYPTASLIEHNCTPNTYQNIDKSDNFKIKFSAGLPIEKSQNITSIYTHILWGTSARRDHLKQSKYFECSCDRCKDPTEFGTYLSALKCLGTEKEPCGGTQLPVNPIDFSTNWLCDKCKIQLPNEDIMKFVNHLSGKVDKLLAKRVGLDEMEAVLEKLLTFLHPHHYLVYSVKHSMVQLFGNLGSLEITSALLQEKLGICEELIWITRKIDPGNARLALYLVVLLNEKFTAKFKLLTREFDKSDKENFMGQIKKVSNILQENDKALKNELQGEAGKKLQVVLELNKMAFSNWSKENEIILE